MAYTSVTYTFSNSTTADATQVNQNFTDLVNGLSDGTKDISVNAITAAGTATLNGNINLGNSSSDDLTITAALAGSVSVKTNATYNVGSSTLGLLSIYLGATGSYTVRLTPSASQSATYTLTLPTTAGTKGYIPYNSDGSGTLTWEPNQKGVKAASADYTILDNDGFYSILVTTGASDRTITLPAAANNTGRSIFIKKIDSGAGKVLISGTIDGVATSAVNEIVPQYGSSELYSDGSSWYYLRRKDTGRTDAVTVPAYYIGQLVEPSSAIVTTIATTSEADVTNASITLTPGVWEIKYSVSVYVATGSSSGNTSHITVCVTDSSNTHIGKTDRVQLAKTVAAVVNEVDGCLAASTVVNISASTTYKLRLKRIDGAGTGTAGVYVSAGVYESTFYAVRIA